MTNTESKSNPFASADSVPAGVNRRETDTSASYLVLPRELQVALHEAASLGSGEVHLDTAAGPGSIFAARGAIAWVARAAAESTLGDLLQLRGVASREVLRSTYQACVRDRRNFAETLIASGAVPRDAMRDVLLEHNARQLVGLANASIRQHRVIHRFREYSSDLVFRLDELLRVAGDLAHEGRAVPAPRNSTQPLVASRRSGAIRLLEVPKEGSYNMADIKQSLEDVMKIDGAIATALVDWESGLTLGTLKAGAFDIELAASGNTQVVKSKMNVMRQLGIRGPIEDILITLDSQYHLIRPLSKVGSLFLYVAIDKERSNLGLARHRLKSIEENLSI